MTAYDIETVNKQRLYILELEIRLKDALFEIDKCHRNEIAYRKLKEDNAKLSAMVEDLSCKVRGVTPIRHLSDEEWESTCFGLGRYYPPRRSYDEIF